MGWGGSKSSCFSGSEKKKQHVSTNETVVTNMTKVMGVRRGIPQTRVTVKFRGQEMVKKRKRIYSERKKLK